MKSLALLTLIVTACAHAPAPVPTPAPVALPHGVPDTVAGHQLAWVLDALQHTSSLDKATIEAHFDPSFLAKLSTEQTLAAFPQLAGHLNGMTVSEIKPGDDNHIVLRGAVPEGHFAINLAVNPATKQIASLNVTPDVGAGPTSWAEAKTMVAALGARSQFLVAELDHGACKPIVALNPDDELALGSAFKLYVLLGLTDRILAGKSSWDDQLAVRDDWKSLPSGITQNDPAGAKLAIRTWAERMISISDNTAADTLLYTVGRENVEAAVVEAKHAKPALNVPFLGTRELFWLKLAMSPAEIDAYLKSSPAQRRAFLDGLAGKHPPIDHADEWKSPRHIDTLEWFASSNDLCRLAGALWERAQNPKGAPLLDVLAKNPGVKDRGKWAYIGFKGGSEPGVLNLTWILRATNGRWFFVSMGVNGTAALDEGRVAGIGFGLVDLAADETGVSQNTGVSPPN